MLQIFLDEELGCPMKIVLDGEEFDLRDVFRSIVYETYKDADYLFLSMLPLLIEYLVNKGMEKLRSKDPVFRKALALRLVDEAIEKCGETPELLNWKGRLQREAGNVTLSYFEDIVREVYSDWLDDLEKAVDEFNKKSRREDNKGEDDLLDLFY